MALDDIVDIRPRTSTRRHRPGMYGGKPTTPVAARSSATRRGPAQAQHQRGRRTDEDEQLIDELAANTPTQRRRGSGHTEKLAHQDYQQPRRGRAPLFWMGVGMCVVLVIWILLVRASVWYTNTLHDPAYYTQTAHLDAATVMDAQGHRSQVWAFVDPQNRIGLLIIPADGDTSKTRVIVGPALTGIDDPQHQATVTVVARGTIVTITAQGPLMANWLVANRQTFRWATDISSSKGGK